jgi:hypothetical protein
MTSQVVVCEDPANAPLSRKLLGFRVILVNALMIFGAFQMIDWVDHAKIQMPHWLQTIVTVPLVLAFLSFFWTISAAGTDLTAHFLRDGKLRSLLLKGDKSPQQIAEEFAQSGYWIALLPLILAGGAVLIAVAVAVVIGGFALAGGAIAGVFNGWPPWAIVITILLVLILVKK